MSEGWQFDYTSNVGGAANLVENDSFQADYDPSSDSYTVTLPLSGAGALYQLDPAGPRTFGIGFAAVQANSSSQAATRPGTMEVFPAGGAGSRYSYVAFGIHYSDVSLGGQQRQVAYGAFGLAQATAAKDIPVTGTARYEGTVAGVFEGDAYGSWLKGTSRFDFDFLSGALTGDIKVITECMMGCFSDEVTYTVTSGKVARGANSFGGSLTLAGAPGEGTLSGVFAGPKAEEMLARFRLPYFHPDYQKWVQAGGVIVGKR